jgi:uncharacterized small protein (DUF1192 family)
LTYHRSEGGWLYSYSLGGAAHADDSATRKEAYQHLAERRIELEKRIGHDLDRGGLLSRRINSATMGLIRRVANKTDADGELDTLAGYFQASYNMKPHEREAFVRRKARAIAAGHDIQLDSIPIRSAGGTVYAKRDAASKWHAFDANDGTAAVPGEVGNKSYDSLSALVDDLGKATPDQPWEAADPMVAFTPVTTFYSTDALDVLAFAFEANTLVRAFDPNASALGRALGEPLARYAGAVAAYNARPTDANAKERDEARAAMFAEHDRYGLAARHAAGETLSDADAATLFDDPRANKWAEENRLGEAGMQGAAARMGYAKELAAVHAEYVASLDTELQPLLNGKRVIAREGVRAWAFKPNGFNSPDAVYLNAAALWNTAVLAEEFVENAFRTRRRFAGSVGVLADGSYGFRYKPAARRFMDSVERIAERMVADVKDKPELAADFQVVLDLAKEGAYNNEFFSKTMSAVILGNSAPDSFGYPALNAMAAELRKDTAYPEFVALVERMLGGDPGVGFKKLSMLADAWTADDAAASTVKSQLSTAEQSYNGDVAEAILAIGANNKEAFDSTPWDPAATFKHKYTPPSTPPSEVKPSAPVAGVAVQPATAGAEPAINVADAGAEPSPGEADALKSVAALDEELAALTGEIAKLAAEREAEPDPAKKKEMADRIADLDGKLQNVKDDIAKAAPAASGQVDFNLGAVVSDERQAVAMLLAASALADKLPDRLFKGLTGDDDQMRRILREAAGNPRRAIIQRSKDGRLAEYAAAALALISRWMPEVADATRTANGDTLAVTWAKTVRGKVNADLAEAGTEDEAAQDDRITDGLGIDVGEVGSLGKLDAIEKSTAFRAFVNLAKLLSPADRTSENASDIVIKMRDEAAIAFAKMDWLLEAFDATVENAKSSRSAYADPGAYSELVTQLMRQPHDASPRLFALGVTLQALGFKAGRTLLPYLRSNAPMSLLTPDAKGPRSDPRYSTKIELPWHTVDSTFVARDAAILIVDNLRSADPVGAAAEHVGAIDDAIGRMLGAEYAPGTKASIDALEKAASAMIGLDGKMDFERLAAVYDAIYGTRENRVSSALRSRNTTTRLLKGFNPFAVDANQGDMATLFIKELKGLARAADASRMAIHGRYEANAARWAADRNLGAGAVERARMIAGFERGSLAKAMDGVDATSDVEGLGLISSFLHRAAQTGYKSRVVTRERGGTTATVGVAAGLPPVVHQIADSLDASWFLDFGVDAAGAKEAARRMRRDGVYPDGTPVVSNITGYSKIGDAVYEYASWNVVNAMRNGGPDYVALPMYYGGHQYIALNLPSAWVARLVGAPRTDVGAPDTGPVMLDKLYANLVKQLAPVLEVPAKRAAQVALGTLMELPSVGEATVMIAQNYYRATGQAVEGEENAASEGLNGFALYSGDIIGKFHMLWRDGLQIKATQQYAPESTTSSVLAQLQKRVDSAKGRGMAVLADVSGAKNNPFFGKQTLFVKTGDGMRKLGDIVVQAMQAKVRASGLAESELVNGKAREVELDNAEIKQALADAGVDPADMTYSRRDGGLTWTGALDALVPQAKATLWFPGEGAAPLLIPSFTTTALSVRIAASLGEHHAFSPGQIPVNMISSMLASAPKAVPLVDAWRSAVAAMVDSLAADSGAATQESEAFARLVDTVSQSNPTLAEALSREAVFVRDREVIAASAAREAAYATRLTSLAVPMTHMVDSGDGRSVMTRDGAPIWDADRAFMKLDGSFGNTANPWVRHSYVFAKAERDRDFHGLKRRLTLTTANVNAPWARQALLLRERKVDGKTLSQRELVNAFAERVVKLDGLMNDAKAYNAHVRNNIAPLVVREDGASLFFNENGARVVAKELDQKTGLDGYAMEAVSFHDLVIQDPADTSKRVFDWAAMYWDGEGGADAVPFAGERRAMVAGSIFHGERIPSSAPVSGDVWRWSLPRNTTAPVKNTVKRRVVMGDGTVAVIDVSSSAERDVADDGLVTKTPEQAHLAGSDADGDKTPTLAFFHDPETGAIRTRVALNEAIDAAKNAVAKGKRAFDAIAEAAAPYANAVAHARNAAYRDAPVERVVPEYRSAKVDAQSVRYAYAYTVDTMPVTAKLFPPGYDAARFSNSASLNGYTAHHGAFATVFGKATRENGPPISHLLPKPMREAAGEVKSFGDLVAGWDKAQKPGYAASALNKPPVPYDPVRYKDVMDMAKSVDDVGGLGRSLGVAFTNTANTLHAAGLWAAVRPDVDAPTHAQFRRMLAWADRVANAAFDVENEGTFIRAQLTTDLLRQYYAGLLSRNWDSDAELLAYHDAWMLWAQSPEGRVVASARAETYRRHRWDPRTDSDWVAREDALDAAEAAAALSHVSNKMPKSVDELLSVQDKLASMADRLRALPSDHVSTHVAQAFLMLERRLNRVRDAYLGAVELTPVYLSHRLEHKEYLDELDKLSGDERTRAERNALAPPAMFGARLAHAADVATALAMFAEFEGGRVYNMLAHHPAAEFLLIAETAFASLRANALNEWTQGRNTPLAKLGGNKFLAALKRRTGFDKADKTNKYNSWFRAGYADFASDIDGIRGDYDAIANTSAKIEVEVAHGSAKAAETYEFTPRQILELLFVYNAMTTSSAGLVPGATTGFGFMFPAAKWREFTERRTSMVSSRAFVDGAAPNAHLKMLVDGIKYKVGATEAFGIMPFRHANLQTVSSPLGANGKRVGAARDGSSTLMQTDVSEYSKLVFDFPFHRVTKEVGKDADATALPSRTWLSEVVPQAPNDGILKAAAHMAAAVKGVQPEVIGAAKGQFEARLSPEQRPAAINPVGPSSSGDPLVLPDRDIAIIDTETTGLDHGTAQLVQISVRTYDANGAKENYTTFVRTGLPFAEWEPGAQSKSSWTQAELEEIATRAPTPKDVFAEVTRKIAGKRLVGHNIFAFDGPMLKRWYEEAGEAVPDEIADQDNYIDTLDLARLAIANDESHQGREVRSWAKVPQNASMTKVHELADKVRASRGLDSENKFRGDADLETMTLLLGMQEQEGAHHADVDVNVTAKLYGAIKANWPLITGADPQGSTDFSRQTGFNYNTGRAGDGLGQPLMDLLKNAAVGSQPKGTKPGRGKGSAKETLALFAKIRRESDEQSKTAHEGFGVSVTSELGVFDPFLGPRDDKTLANQGTAAHAVLEQVFATPGKKAESAWAEGIRTRVTELFPPSDYDYVVELPVAAGALSGRIDLIVVDRKTGRATLFDFKPFRDAIRYKAAGNANVTPLDHHSAQLFVYQDMLRYLGANVADEAYIIPYSEGVSEDAPAPRRADETPMSLALTALVTSHIDAQDASAKREGIERAASLVGASMPGRDVEDDITMMLKEAGKLRGISPNTREMFSGFHAARASYQDLPPASETRDDPEMVKRTALSHRVISSAIAKAEIELRTTSPKAHAYASWLRADSWLMSFTPPRSRSTEDLRAWRYNFQHRARKAQEAYNDSMDGASAVDKAALTQLWALHKAGLHALNVMELYWRDHQDGSAERLFEAAAGMEPPSPYAEPLESFIVVEDPDTGLSPADFKRPVPFRMLSESDYFRAMVMPSLGSRGMREVVQERGIEKSAVRSAEAARNWARALGIDDPELISPMKEGTRQFGFDAKTGQHRELREGDPGYDAPSRRVARLGLFQKTFGYLRKTKDQHDLLVFLCENAALMSALGNDRVITAVGLTVLDWTDARRRPALPTSADVMAIVPGQSKTKRLDDPNAPVHALEVAITQLYDVLPEALRKPAHEAIARAVELAGSDVQHLVAADDGRVQGDTLLQMNAHFARHLFDAGFGVRQLAGKTTDDLAPVRAINLAVPFTALQEAFNSDADLIELLKKSGRDVAEYDIAALGRKVKAMFGESNAALLAATPYMTSSVDARRLFDLRGAVPFVAGGGAYRVFNEAATEFDIPTTAELLGRIRESLDKTLEAGSSGLPLSKANYPGPMIRLFSDLAGIQDVKDGDTWKNMQRGFYASHGIGKNATLGDLAKAIYNLSLHRVSQLSITTDDASVNQMQSTLGVELGKTMQAMAAAAKRLGWDVDMSAMTPTEVFEKHGILPSNAGASQLLATHATQVAAGLQYKYAINNALLMQDPSGKPLVYARPGEVDDGTLVGEATWTMLARWWADANGWEYDSTKTGTQNAKEMYERIANTPDLATDNGEVREVLYRPNSDKPGTMFREIRNETSSSVPRFLVRLADPGDTRDGFLAAMQGGDTVAWMLHLLKSRKINALGQRQGGYEYFNQYVKSVAMSLSLFHLVATVGESSAVAQGSFNTITGLFHSDAQRAMGKTKVGKALNLDENTMGEWNLMDAQLDVDDPFYADVVEIAEMIGISMSSPTNNPWDVDKSLLKRDLKRMVKWAKSSGSPVELTEGSGRVLEKLLFAMQENLTEYTFMRLANATKLTVMLNLITKLRAEAAAQGRWFDPVREMRKWAPYINAEIGGIDPVSYPFMNPAAVKWLRRVMLSWQWTFGAWEAAGGGALTRSITGFSLHPDVQSFMLVRWARMLSGVMYGVPLLMQFIISSIARMSGDDDNELWVWDNEIGRQNSFDITPMLRMIGRSPRVAWMKDTLPFGGLIPAAIGDDPTLGNRRYYMHFGKQAWEIMRWFQDPGGNAYSKAALPLQRMFVAINGSAPNSNFEESFKGRPFGETFAERLSYFAGVVTPMSLSSYRQNKDAGFLTAVGPVSKGVSASAAADNIRTILRAYADRKEYSALLASPKYWNNYPNMAVDWLRAAERNGHNPKIVLRDAMKPITTHYYREVYASLPSRPTEKVDEERLAIAVSSLLRLDFNYSGLLKSIATRDERNAGKIKITDEVLKERREGMAEAFWYPDGRFEKKDRKKIPGGKGTADDWRKTQSADKGGNTRGLLDTDSVPDAMFGYPVLSPSPDDLAFFEKNPDVAGFFDLDPDYEPNPDEMFDDVDDDPNMVED